MDLDFAKASPDRGDQTGKKHLTKLEMKLAKERVKIAKEELKKEKEEPKKGKSKTKAERSEGEEGGQGLKSVLVIQGMGRVRKRSTVSVSRISSFIISPICRIVFSCVLFLYNDCKPQS